MYLYCFVSFWNGIRMECNLLSPSRQSAFPQIAWSFPVTSRYLQGSPVSAFLSTRGSSRDDLGTPAGAVPSYPSLPSHLNWIHHFSRLRQASPVGEQMPECEVCTWKHGKHLLRAGEGNWLHCESNFCGMQAVYGAPKLENLFFSLPYSFHPSPSTLGALALKVHVSRNKKSFRRAVGFTTPTVFS